MIVIIFFIVSIYLTLRSPLVGVYFSSIAFVLNAALGIESGVLFFISGALTPILSIFTLIYLILFRMNFNPRVNFIGFPFIIISIFLLLLMSSIYAGEPYLSLEIAFRFLFLCALFGFGSYFYSLNTTAKFYSDMIFLSKFVAILCLVISIYALSRGDSSSQYVVRLTIGDASSIPLSIILAQGVICAFFNFIYLERNYHKVFYLFIFLFVFYVFILTNTRSTLIGLILSLTFLLWKIFRNSNERVKVFTLKFIIFSSVMLFISGGYFLSFIDPDMFQRLFEGFDRITEGSYGESEGDRMIAWGYALDVFSDNLILGIGAGNFGQYYIAYPHNIFLEMLSENGLLGFLFIFFPICYALYFCFFKCQSEIEQLYCSLFLLTIIVSQVSLTLWMHKYMFFWMGFIFFRLVSDNKRRAV